MTAVIVGPTCSHPHCARLKPEEILAAAVVGALMGVAGLDRVCEQATAARKPDFRLFAEDKHAVFEVKRLTSGTMQRHIADRRRYLGTEPFHRVPSLRWTWLVFVDTSIARKTFDADSVSPRLDQLIRALTVELERLEAAGITDGGEDPLIRRLTHSWTCSAVPNSQRLGPGILISESHGGTRTTDLETDVVWFLIDWLGSDRADNLRASLDREPGRRIAVLVADTDGPAEGMIRTLGENNDCPVTPLQMPAEIDVVILVAAGHVLDYGLDGGWRRRSLESLRVTGSE